MLLLALDTATPAVTVALHDGDRVLARFDQVDARRHGELLLPGLDQVMTEAGRTLEEVTGIVVGTGPGPYTGLRVGLATATALGAARSLPVHGLCTLDALAYATAPGVGTPPAVVSDGPLIVATDARRKEVYWARYHTPRDRDGEPQVSRPSELPPEVATLPAVGAGTGQYPSAFPARLPDGPQHASAAALAALAAERLAVGTSLAPPQPRYLRRPDAAVPAGYKAVTPTAVAERHP